MRMRQIDQWDSTAALLAATAAPEGRDAMWAQSLAFLGAGPRDDAHLVASVIVVNDDGLVLLARHRRYGRWGPLGGHLEAGDESIAATAARELIEETSLAAHVHPAPIDVRLSSYPCRTAINPVPHLDVCFVARVDARARQLLASAELTGLEWFARGDLPAPIVPLSAKLVDLAIAADTLRR